MPTGVSYRVISSLGVAVLAALAVVFANLPFVQAVFTTVTPLFWNLDPIVLSRVELVHAIGLSVAIVWVCLLPLYKPQPRRVLDTILMAQKRVIIAGLALATLGYFNYSYRLPRATLAMTVGILLLAIPGWFVWVRHRPGNGTTRVVIIGDDPAQFAEIVKDVDLPFIGQVSPPVVLANRSRAMADGGVELARLGGLSRVDEVLVDHDIDTAVLAFREPDRSEFFGVLDACYEFGVNVKVHGMFADSVLTDDVGGDVLVDVAIEPLDLQDYLLKRTFDVAFATVGLVVLSPLMLLIALAIKLDDGGSVLYSQERTAGFGDAIRIHKFRTMTPAEESPDPNDDAERITRVGAVLRRTHLDEIPQLWAVLVGRMSVVGPRAVWVEEENLIEATVDPKHWRQRWFVKPGLTGLAQIYDVDSRQPEAKLRYDLEYIRRQTFWLDLKIVVRQLWMVARDIALTVLRRPPTAADTPDDPRFPDSTANRQQRSAEERRNYGD